MEFDDKFARDVQEAEHNFCDNEKEFVALLSKCEMLTGVKIQDDFDDQATWQLFAEGRYVYPFFTPEYGNQPRPQNFDDLTEHVATGFFMKKDFNESMELFLEKKKNNKRSFVFREDVDELFRTTFALTDKEAQIILRDIRNPVREQQGKAELHRLFINTSLLPEFEEAFYKAILRTRSTLTKRAVATACSKKIYQLAFYQANYPMPFYQTY